MALSLSLNVSIVESKGQYIAQIDSDDIWNDHKLEKGLKLILKTNRR